jgi:RimJ/RimL family protein N-acetyltransferase
VARSPSMSRTQYVYDLPSVIAFMRSLMPGMHTSDDMVAIGLKRDERLVAGVLYEGINAHNCWMHVAGEPGSRWLTRDYLRTVFAYPFLVCGVRRISGYVDAQNHQARRFDEHLGFQEEARLSGAGMNGGDVILYVMWRDECRFLDLEFPHG